MTRYRIGEFARLTRLTVTTLRHYDDVGVLRPAVVDPTTGYRYYVAEQVTVGVQVAVLRSLGLPPAELRRLTSGEDELVDVLRRHRQQVHEELIAQGERLAAVEALLAGRLDLVVEVVDCPARRVAALRATSTWGGAATVIQRALARVLRTLVRAGAGVVRPAGALLPVEPVDSFDVTVFVGCEDVPAGLDALDLPAGRRVSTTVDGPYELLPLAYRALLDDATGRGLAPVGEVREEYWPDVDGVPRTTVSVGLA